MEDTVKNKNDNIVVDAAKVLEEHKARNVTAIDVREQSSWTDYFIIATVNSQGHMRGVLKNVTGYLADKGIELRNKSKRIDEFSWLFIDCGFMVIHLMDEETRKFYDLENLWFNGRDVYSSNSP